jgi:hypothetical protein
VVLALVVVAGVAVVEHPSQFRLSRWNLRNGWPVHIAGWLAASALLMPVYLKLAPTVGQSVVSGQSGGAAPGLADFASSMTVIYRDAPWLWKPALLFTALTPIVLVKSWRRSPLWAITTSLVVSLIVEGVVLGQSRLVYLAPVAVAFALVLWLQELAHLNAGIKLRSAGARRLFVPVAIALIMASVLYCSVQGLQFFPTQRAFYGAIEPPGTLAGLDWIRLHTPADALIAVAPENGSPFGWWVQGYARRAAMVGSEDEWLNFPQERTRANEVVALLSEPDPLVNAVMSHASKLGAQYILIPWSWGGLSHAQLHAFERTHRHQVVFDNSAMVLISVPR